MTSSLTNELLCSEARVFGQKESEHKEPALYGVTDGKAVGTYLEHKFHETLKQKFTYTEGSSARGIDFPDLGVDMKVTRIKQPQSSCPFKSARQKIYGLGYSLLVFVYDKHDDDAAGTSTLEILHIVFVDQACTADYQTTTGIIKILVNDGNKDDLLAFMEERRLPVDEIEASNLADEIIENPPRPGYLTSLSHCLDTIESMQSG